MEKILKYLDGKKTYIGIALTGILGILGVSDEAMAANPAGLANTAGIVIASAAAFYGRMMASKKMVAPKKKRKSRKKKVVDGNA